MGKNEPVTKTVKASEARQQWSELLNEVFKRETRVVVEKSGVPVAAIISIEDLQRLKQSEARRAEHFKALDESWSAMSEAFKDVDPEEIEREVAKAVAEARRQLRAERLQAQKSA